MHTVDLGIAQRFCATAMVKALKSNIYKLPYKTAGKLVRKGCLMMARDIKAYYTADHARIPYKNVDVIENIQFESSWEHLQNRF